MELGLHGRKALVTASSDGIGKGIAKVLVDEGASVTLCGRNEEKLATVQQELGAAHSLSCDLTSASGVALLIEQYEERFGVPEILVINTAGPPKGVFAETALDDWTRGFEVIWAPAIQLMQFALPEMKKRKWGRIVLSTSLAAREPASNMLISGALRSGLSHLVRNVAREVAGFGVTVNAVLPGWTNTAAVKKMGDRIQPILEQIPAGRLAAPEEIGALVAFLTSNQAGYLTGESIAVEGGILRGY